MLNVGSQCNHPCIATGTNVFEKGRLAMLHVRLSPWKQTIFSSFFFFFKKSSCFVSLGESKDSTQRVVGTL